MQIVSRSRITVIGNSPPGFTNVPVEKKKIIIIISNLASPRKCESVPDENSNISVIILCYRV